jgi:hypothetical protein
MGGNISQGQAKVGSKAKTHVAHVHEPTGMVWAKGERLAHQHQRTEPWAPHRVSRQRQVAHVIRDYVAQASKKRPSALQSGKGHWNAKRQRCITFLGISGATPPSRHSGACASCNIGTPTWQPRWHSHTWDGVRMGLGHCLAMPGRACMSRSKPAETRIGPPTTLHMSRDEFGCREEGNHVIDMGQNSIKHTHGNCWPPDVERT